MKTLFALTLGTALVAGVLPTFAGGPVVIEDRYDTEVETDRAHVGVLPVVVGLILICALACGGSDEDAPAAPPKPVCNGGC